MKWHAAAHYVGLILPLTVAFLALTQHNDQYEYIVVGSGAGGGPLASRLARAGKKTLLIEAGDDQSDNDNTTIPIFQTLVSGDPKIRWDYFVNHYQDQERAQTDPKFVYDVGDGELYTGLTPPQGAEPKGILYPRAGTLGGCVTHNALIWITPHDSDWDNIANITGDSSWSAANMSQYLDNAYEWQPVNPTDPSILLKDPQLVQQLGGGAGEISPGIDLLQPEVGLANALLGDPNARLPGRDAQTGFYPIPLIAQNGQRVSVREHIKDTVAQGYPLTIQTNTFVTGVIFDTSSSEPKATGVNYLSGSHLYSASPLSGSQGTPGSATASKEVILSAGTYNTVQLLKLSGIGPKDELESFNIPVLVDSPGVGTNLQDRYEIGLNVEHTKDFSVLDGCTLDAKPHDECYAQWKNNSLQLLAARGTYATDGLAAAMVDHSDFTDNSDVDLFIFGSPSNFTGYFPHWYDTVVQKHDVYSWYTLKAHTRNRAGTVTLRSANPLDTPEINFNYFDTGTTEDGADEKDLAALVEALKTSRAALERYRTDPVLQLLGGSNFTEIYPGPLIQSDEDLGTYVKNRAWGHHACGTNPIGADNDPNAVLDSKFRVRGTQGLRVVDASIFPHIPGVFITAPIVIASEKAAAAILSG